MMSVATDSVRTGDDGGVRRMGLSVGRGGAGEGRRTVADRRSAARSHPFRCRSVPIRLMGIHGDGTAPVSSPLPGTPREPTHTQESRMDEGRLPGPMIRSPPLSRRARSGPCAIWARPWVHGAPAGDGLTNGRRPGGLPGARRRLAPRRYAHESNGVEALRSTYSPDARLELVECLVEPRGRPPFRPFFLAAFAFASLRIWPMIRGAHS